MTDATRRGVRTFIDVAFVEAVLQLVEAFGVGLTEAQHVAVLVIAPFFVSAAKNALEDRGTIPALLKAPPSPGANPVPDAGAVAWGTVALVVIAAVALFIWLGVEPPR